ncbi:MAG: type II toxin-antitoxin system VapC family toxin [Nitrospirota bacterium]
MSILIDSDILIEVSRGVDKKVLDSWTRLSDSDEVLLCSPVTIAELWHGARPNEHGILNDLFTALLCVPIDREIGHRAGDYLRQYHKSHHLELGDALIAATATIQEAALWTRNRKHYPMRSLTFF